MRTLLLLLLIAGSAAAGEGAGSAKAKDTAKPSTAATAGSGAASPLPPEPGHDALGFPVFVNDEIISRGDVQRSLGGVTEAQIGDEETLRHERDRLIQSKLLEEIAKIYRFQVNERLVNDLIKKQIDVQGGEAPFYEWLAQRGQTMESYRQTVRTEILQSYRNSMLQTGIAPGHLLPYDIPPTPREVAIAFRTDRAKHPGEPRIRYLQFAVQLGEKESKKLAVMAMTASAEASDAARQKALAPLVKKAEADIAGKGGFAAAAAARGVDVAAQETRWVDVPAPGGDTATFLRKAKPGETSPPLPQPDGRVVFLHLLARAAADAALSDPHVYEFYADRIRQLRAKKAEALLFLRALADSTVEPKRVADEYRGGLEAQVQDAMSGLKALGLH